MEKICVRMEKTCFQSNDFLQYLEMKTLKQTSSWIQSLFWIVHVRSEMALKMFLSWQDPARHREWNGHEHARKSKYFLHTLDAQGRQILLSSSCLSGSGRSLTWISRQAKTALSPWVKILGLQRPAACSWLRTHMNEIMTTISPIPAKQLALCWIDFPGHWIW